MSITRALLLLLLLAGACTADQPKKLPDNPQAPAFDHGAFDALLFAHVDAGGRVDYAALQRERAKLQAYLARLAAADWEKLRDRRERFAFWINAYNAACLEGVLQTLPAERSKWPAYSVLNVSGFFKKRAYALSGKQRTLDDVEHKILRVQFADPRLHFAIVCASIGCPNLRAEAYTAERLERQLDAGARAFVNDPAKVKIDIASRKLKISKIFNWFRGDFEKDGSNVPRFLARFVSDERTARALRDLSWSTDHLDYDWKLNLKQ